MRQAFEFNRGTWTRTTEYGNQNPMSYQLDDTSMNIHRVWMFAINRLNIQERQNLISKLCSESPFIFPFNKMRYRICYWKFKNLYDYLYIDRKYDF